jgi:hypothetical protein
MGALHRHQRNMAMPSPPPPITLLQVLTLSSGRARQDDEKIAQFKRTNQLPPASKGLPERPDAEEWREYTESPEYYSLPTLWPCPRPVSLHPKEAVKANRDASACVASQPQGSKMATGSAPISWRALTGSCSIGISAATAFSPTKWVLVHSAARCLLLLTCGEAPRSG